MKIHKPLISVSKNACDSKDYISAPKICKKKRSHVRPKETPISADQNFQKRQKKPQTPSPQNNIHVGVN